MLTLYELGLLYGDGSFKTKNIYLFSTTKKELADIIEKRLVIQKVKHNKYQRRYKQGKENWKTLQIVEITGKKFVNYLKVLGLGSKNPNLRIKNDPDFLRGYIETKAAFHPYINKNVETWRLAISGNKEDLLTIVEVLSDKISEKKIKRRREREKFGIISESFRFAINKRDEIKNIVDYICTAEEITEELKTKIQHFNEFYKKEPFNMNRFFKSEKYAVKAMAKKMNLEIRGIRGGDKNIYLWKDKLKIRVFSDWEQAYFWIINEYKDKTGKTPPIIKK